MIIKANVIETNTRLIVKVTLVKRERETARVTVINDELNERGKGLINEE